MAFFVAAFKARITYRNSALFAMAGSIMEICIKLALWVYLYRNSREMTEYMIMYTVLSNVISLFILTGLRSGSDHCRADSGRSACCGNGTFSIYADLHGYRYVRHGFSGDMGDPEDYTGCDPVPVRFFYSVESVP